MIRAIDHLVIVVRDLADATRDYAALGFAVTPGGTHADGQTHNALVAFADGVYLELIAFIDPAKPSGHYWWPRLAEGEGLEDFCLLSDDLASDAAQWQAAGLAAQGPSAGGRQRPDGQQLQWQTVRFGQPADAATLPFVIQDVSPRALRVPTASAHTLAITPTSITRLIGLRVVTDDLQAAMRDYVTLLGSVPIGQDAHTARFIVGSQWIASHAPGPTDDAMQQHLQAHGPGPYEFLLGGAAPMPTKQPILLDPTLTHGARIWVE